jgi:hypothetical protein
VPTIRQAWAAANADPHLWRDRQDVGETRGQLGPLYDGILIPLRLRHLFADKERQEAGKLLARISRADVAHFMLEELVRRTYVRHAVSLCY